MKIRVNKIDLIGVWGEGRGGGEENIYICID